MVPVRVVSEYLGSTVNWDADNNAVYIQPNNETPNTTTSNTSNTNNPTVTLTQEQKAEQLKSILINSVQILESDIDRTDMISELHYAHTYIGLHAEYTKFNALFSEEFLTNENLSSTLLDIDQLYINALKTVSFSIDDSKTQYYDFNDPTQWYDRIQTNFTIILVKFNYYISINGKYY